MCLKKIVLFALIFFALITNVYADKTFRTTEYFLGLGLYPKESYLIIKSDGKLCMELYTGGPEYCPEESSWSVVLLSFHAYYYGINIYSEYNGFILEDVMICFRLYRTLDSDESPDMYYILIGYEI